MELEKYIACHECDLIHERVSIEEGETALCRRCGASLYSEKVDMVNRSLALNMSALVLYLIAISLPFLGIEAKGIIVEINLFQSVSALYSQNMKLLSVVVCLVLLVIPGLRILGMLLILIPLKLSKVPPHSKWAYYFVEWIAPWNMVEVFLIGILVTFVKLGDLAQILLGISFWAFVALVVVIIASNISVDRHRFWDQLEPV
jgi:paraquat-inducible protein A